MSNTVIVRGLPPVWGTPSPSPFVIKLLTWLRMADIEHELRPLRAPPRSRTKKIPYIELPNGEVLADSGRIIAHLSAERSIDLDAELDPQKRALSRLLACTFEDHLYFTGLYERFATPEGFAHTRRDYFRALPFLLRVIVPRVIRRNALRNLYGQGMGRMPRETVAELGRKDIVALATFLGDSPYFLGDAPSSIDATATGFLWALTSHPWESPVRATIEQHEPLVRYLARMRERYWSGWTM